MLVCVSIDIDTMSVHFRYNLVNSGLVHQISHVFLRCASITSASHLMISVSVSAVRRSTTRSAQEEGLVINIREFIINVTIHNTTVFRSFVRKISVERI